MNNELYQSMYNRDGLLLTAPPPTSVIRGVGADVRFANGKICRVVGNSNQSWILDNQGSGVNKILKVDQGVRWWWANNYSQYSEQLLIEQRSGAYGAAAQHNCTQDRERYMKNSRTQILWGSEQPGKGSHDVPPGCKVQKYRNGSELLMAPAPVVPAKSASRAKKPCAITRPRKPLVITDKDGNAIDLSNRSGGKSAVSADNEEEMEGNGKLENDVFALIVDDTKGKQVAANADLGRPPLHAFSCKFKDGKCSRCTSTVSDHSAKQQGDHAKTQVRSSSPTPTTSTYCSMTTSAHSTMSAESPPFVFTPNNTNATSTEQQQPPPPKVVRSFYCELCQMSFKKEWSLLQHVNGVKHSLALKGHVLDSREHDGYACLVDGCNRVFQKWKKAKKHMLNECCYTERSGDLNIEESAKKASSPEIQRITIGDRIYHRILWSRPELDAGKITGMLMEMETAELVILLESPEEFDETIQEALELLEAHGGTGLKQKECSAEGLEHEGLEQQQP